LLGEKNSGSQKKKGVGKRGKPKRKEEFDRETEVRHPKRDKTEGEVTMKKSPAN